MTHPPPGPECIARILPHRPPFLLVDGIDLLDGSRIAARLFLDPQMVFFAGHFPGEPIMPGVLVTEALAQTAGLLLGLRFSSPTPSPAYFLARTEMKFLNSAGPGDTLCLHAELTRNFGSLFRFAVASLVGERRIAEGNLSLARRPARGPR